MCSYTPTKELILLWNGFRILYKRPDLIKSLLELVHETQRKQSTTRSDGEKKSWGLFHRAFSLRYIYAIIPTRKRVLQYVTEQANVAASETTGTNALEN